jgi:maltooligosyltrehalose trehalohydrolase
VIDPDAFRWTDQGWGGVGRDGQVVYEMHAGSFTPEGTWAAAARELPALAELGVTVLEVMPVADFPGRFGWGYDGVNRFAPTRLCGTPDDFLAFVDRAHALGLGVILDVVSNHLGPEGNYLTEFSGSYFTDRYKTDWGEPLNFDGPDSGPVREFFVAVTGSDARLPGPSGQQILDAHPVFVRTTDHASISGSSVPHQRLLLPARPAPSWPHSCGTAATRKPR